jgi:hypothetical protein
MWTFIDDSTSDNFLNFMMNELLLLMENMPLETRHGVFQWTLPYFVCQIVAYMNDHYKNHWICYCDPVPCLSRLLDLTLLDFFL